VKSFIVRRTLPPIQRGKLDGIVGPVSTVVYANSADEAIHQGAEVLGVEAFLLAAFPYETIGEVGQEVGEEG